MKNLNKRYRRNIRHSLSFYICASLLTTISVLFVITMYTSVEAIDTTFSKIMTDGHVEDAEFSTLMPIPDAEQKALENKYDLDLEKILYADIEEDEYNLRVFPVTEKLNRVQIVSGSEITSADEILLNPDFAKAHGVVPGDTFVVNGSRYTVAGTAVRPDYIYAQKNPSDFYVDDSGFGQVTMSKDAFLKFQNVQSFYAVDFHGDNSIEFRKDIHKTYTTLRYLPRDANNRIDVCRDLGKEYGLMLAALLPVVFGMNTLIVAVVLGRKIRREQRQIGTLLAFGYRTSEITAHYMWYAMIPGMVGSVAGTAASVLFSRPLIALVATDFESVNFIVQPHWQSLILCLLLPTLS